MTTELLVLVVLPWLFIFALPLGVTCVIETLVAKVFKVDSEGLRVVLLANCVTNPVLNVVLVTAYLKGWGFRFVGTSRNYGWGVYVPTGLYLAMFMLLELVVVLVEWRLLVWVLGRRISHQRLLLLSVFMNAASAALGTAIIYLIGRGLPTTTF